MGFSSSSSSSSSFWLPVLATLTAAAVSGCMVAAAMPSKQPAPERPTFVRNILEKHEQRQQRQLQQQQQQSAAAAAATVEEEKKEESSNISNTITSTTTRTTTTTMPTTSTTAATASSSSKEQFDNDDDDDEEHEPLCLYYFGLGSNMLRSKLENRGVNGSKIEILEMEPAVIPNYRLSFNLRGFLPLEPGMGSLEPVDDNNSNCSNSRPLLAYDQAECHGALVKLTVDNYEKVMRSEGVYTGNANPGYEEIVVTAYPYDKTKQPVAAVALRARPHVRLAVDACPSARYMDILKEGAAELQLLPCYQTFLRSHPIQQTPVWLKRISIYNLIFTFTVSFQMKWRGLSRFQSRCLFAVYQRPDAAAWKQTLAYGCMAIMLTPGACMGMVMRCYYTVTKKPMNPMIARFVSTLEGGGENKQQQQINNTSNTTTTTTTTTEKEGEEDENKNHEEKEENINNDNIPEQQQQPQRTMSSIAADPAMAEPVSVSSAGTTKATNTTTTTNNNNATASSMPTTTTKPSKLSASN